VGIDHILFHNSQSFRDLYPCLQLHFDGLHVSAVRFATAFCKSLHGSALIPVLSVIDGGGPFTVPQMVVFTGSCFNREAKAATTHDSRFS
jgi:hypothetical protein